MVLITLLVVLVFAIIQLKKANKPEWHIDIDNDENDEYL